MSKLSHNIHVEFSEEASVELPGRWFAAFQQNSYVARVTFPDGCMFVMALPPDAKQRGADHYLNRVLMNAAAAHEHGVTQPGYMTDPPPMEIPDPSKNWVGRS